MTEQYNCKLRPKQLWLTNKKKKSVKLQNLEVYPAKDTYVS